MDIKDFPSVVIFLLFVLVRLSAQAGGREKQEFFPPW